MHGLSRLFSAAVLVGVSGAGAQAAVIIADFDSQYQATAAPVVNSAFLFSGVNTDTAGQSRNVGRYGTSSPTGSTTGFNISQVENDDNTDAVNLAAGRPDTNVHELRFAFIGAAATTSGNLSADPKDTTLRVFTGSGLANPVIALDQKLVFDIYTSNAIRVALNIGDTGDQSGKSIGQAGNTAGVTLETVAHAGTLVTTSTDAPGGDLIPAGAFTTLTYDFSTPSSLQVRGFTGNGVLAGNANSPNRATLNGFFFTPEDGEGGTVQDFQIYIDNIRVEPIPEPTSLTLLAVGGLGLLARRRRM